MQLYISNVSLLTVKETLAAMAFIVLDRWMPSVFPRAEMPSIAECMRRARALGYDGLDVTLFAGWDLRDVMDHADNICAFSAPWFTTPSLKERAVFGEDAHARFEALAEMLINREASIPVVDYDGQLPPFIPSLIELADPPYDPTRRVLAESMRSGEASLETLVVLDLLHDLEFGPGSGRDHWCPEGVVSQILFEPEGVKRYYGGDGFGFRRHSRLVEISAKQFKAHILENIACFMPHTALVQVQTRSREELRRFVGGYESLLEDQVRRVLLCQNGHVPMSVELPPWFSNKDIKNFGQRLRDIVDGIGGT